jgi:hypothetical protein
MAELNANDIPDFLKRCTTGCNDYQSLRTLLLPDSTAPAQGTSPKALEGSLKPRDLSGPVDPDATTCYAFGLASNGALAEAQASFPRTGHL